MSNGCTTLISVSNVVVLVLSLGDKYSKVIIVGISLDDWFKLCSIAGEKGCRFSSSWQFPKVWRGMVSNLVRG